jgi:hypothetical protein
MLLLWYDAQLAQVTRQIGHHDGRRARSVNCKMYQEARGAFVQEMSRLVTVTVFFCWLQGEA